MIVIAPRLPLHPLAKRPMADVVREFYVIAASNCGPGTRNRRPVAKGKESE
jgi:hypothetical protein